MSLNPLADRMRPIKLNDVVGQQHLLSPGKIVYEIIEHKQPISLIFWGPPGTGKTTLARIIAKNTGAEFIELSAVSSNKAEIKNVIELAKINQRLKLPTILFVDEIHRFNKAQQDIFLPYIEQGLIILIGATTENPSFEVNNALLSRLKILILEPLSKEDMLSVINKAAKILKLSKKVLPDESIELLAFLSGGDARIALNNLELASQLTDSTITPEIIRIATQQKIPNYDKDGDEHYNTISAFIKSMRGSDVNAAIYYLARMLQAGEDPKFIARRMIIFASEDIGLEASAALNLAVATFDAVERIGLPECKYNLYHCAIVMAKAKKSRVVADVLAKVNEFNQDYFSLPIPLNLRNASNKTLKDLGYNKGYKWQVNFKVDDGFLPSKINKFNFLD